MGYRTHTVWYNNFCGLRTVRDSIRVATLSGETDRREGQNRTKNEKNYSGACVSYR